jgi:thiol-disulfide isomerase/thioredoxin
MDSKTEPTIDAYDKTQGYKTDVESKTAQNPDKKRIVVVDAYAEWCGPCKAIEPTVNKYVSGEFNLCTC